MAKHKRSGRRSKDWLGFNGGLKTLAVRAAKGAIAGYVTEKVAERVPMVARFKGIAGAGAGYAAGKGPGVGGALVGARIIDALVNQMGASIGQSSTTSGASLNGFAP